MYTLKQSSGHLAPIQSLQLMRVTNQGIRFGQCNAWRMRNVCIFDANVVTRIRKEVKDSIQVGSRDQEKSSVKMKYFNCFVALTVL